jgi:hypothetical protein
VYGPDGSPIYPAAVKVIGAEPESPRGWTNPILSCYTEALGQCQLRLAAGRFTVRVTSRTAAKNVTFRVKSSRVLSIVLNEPGA